MKSYIARSGKTQFKPSYEDLTSCEDDQVGFCLACGDMNTPAEPDARKYRCEACGESKVYGFEELALMGLVYEENSNA